MSKQAKTSISKDEWAMVTSYFETHKEKLKYQGIKTPTALLRRWILEKYEEKTSQQ
jgi:hypothetical protein